MNTRCREKREQIAEDGQVRDERVAFFVETGFNRLLARTFSDVLGEFQAVTSPRAMIEVEPDQVQIAKAQDPYYDCARCFSAGARCNRMALEINRIQEESKNQQNEALGAILGVIQGVRYIQEFAELQQTYARFEENKAWLDANARKIIKASRGARAELKDSVKAIGMFRPKLARSWRRHVATIKKSAAAQRASTAKFEKELRRIEQSAPRTGRAASRSDIAELDSLMKRPRRLKRH